MDHLSATLFQVVATHPHQSEDDDELSFEKDDIINVLPCFADDDKLDDKWLYG